MKKSIFIVLIILISGLNFASADGGRIELFLDHPQQIELNKDFNINFEVFNNSNDRLWDATITIEKEFMDKYGKYIKSNRNYSSNPFRYVVIGPGYRMNDTFTLSLSENFPEEEVKFNIIVEGKKGACRCDSNAIYLKQDVNLKTFFNKTQAALILEKKYFEVLNGDTLNIPVSVNNTGDVLISNVTIEFKGEDLPNKTIEISYVQPGKVSSDIISLLIDTKVIGQNMNHSVVMRYKDQNGNDINTQEIITIKVNEKTNVNEEIKEPVIVEETTENIKFNTNYLIIIIPVVSVLLIIFSYLIIIKR